MLVREESAYRHACKDALLLGVVYHVKYMQIKIFHEGGQGTARGPCFCSVLCTP
jgi:hypothetical protein